MFGLKKRVEELGELTERDFRVVFERLDKVTARDLGFEVSELRREFYEYRHRNPDFKAGDKVWFDNSPYPAWVGEGGAVHHLGGQGIKQCTVTLVSEIATGWRVHDAHNHEYFDAKHSELFPPQKADGSSATADSDEAQRTKTASLGLPMPQVGDSIVAIPRKSRNFANMQNPQGVIREVYANGVIKVDLEGMRNVTLAPGEYVVAEGEQS